MNIAAVLNSCPLFSGLPENQIVELANIAFSKKVKRGVNIFFEGDAGDGFYLVANGKVKVFKLAFNGKEQILHILGDSQPFGEAAVFQGKPFPANAEALVNSELIYFPKKDFLRVIEKNPQVALNMLGLLSARLRKFAHQIEDLSLHEVPHRLANYLLYLTEEQENENQVTLEISKGQLASLLGTVPETLSRILTKFSNDGVLKVSNRTIEITNFEQLKELVL